MEERLVVILPRNEQILTVTRKYYWPSTLLVSCHSAGTCAAEPLSIHGINQVRSNIRVSFDLIDVDSDLN
jgi:hypothetical protein